MLHIPGPRRGELLPNALSHVGISFNNKCAWLLLLLWRNLNRHGFLPNSGHLLLKENLAAFLMEGFLAMFRVWKAFRFKKGLGVTYAVGTH